MAIEKLTLLDGKTVLLDIGSEGKFLIGTEVDDEGCIKSPSKAYLKAHGATSGKITRVIEKTSVKARTPMRINLTYGTLEEA